MKDRRHTITIHTKVRRRTFFAFLLAAAVLAAVIIAKM